MLLRSSSAPIFSSWSPYSKDSSPQPEIQHQFTTARTRSLTLTASPSSMKLSRALSDSHLRDFALAPNSPFSQGAKGFPSEEDRGIGFGFSRTASLDECEVGFLGGGIGRGGGVCGGGGSGDGWSGGGDANHGNDQTEAYYKNMIEANPGNSLILSNYAKFLKEVRGDFAKAEDYCGRAILANPNDGNVLSMYADLVWRSDKDAERAETYFDQAVKAAPDDCYVMASYARFLWDSEEDADDEEAAEDDLAARTPTPAIFHQARPSPPPLAAAS